jgi:hypothetical protein
MSGRIRLKKFHVRRERRSWKAAQWRYGRCSNCKHHADVAPVGSVQLCNRCMHGLGGDAWFKALRALRNLQYHLKHR